RRVAPSVGIRSVQQRPHEICRGPPVREGDFLWLVKARSSGIFSSGIRMTHILPQPTRNAYELSDDLRDDSVIPPELTLPGSEPEREDLVLNKLGAKGWVRLHHFRHYYSAGWGEHSGRPLSPRALETFFRFMEAAQF